MKYIVISVLLFSTARLLPNEASGSSNLLISPDSISCFVLPTYPPIAWDSATEGRVVVLLTISPSGDVTRSVTTSGPVALKKGAEDTVRKWKFKSSQLDFG